MSLSNKALSSEFSLSFNHVVDRALKTSYLLSFSLSLSLSVSVSVSWSLFLSLSSLSLCLSHPLFCTSCFPFEVLSLPPPPHFLILVHIWRGWESCHSPMGKNNIKFGADRHEATKERRRRQQEWAASQSSSAQTLSVQSAVEFNIKYQTLQPPTSVQELTINLPNDPRLRAMNHHYYY